MRSYHMMSCQMVEIVANFRQGNRLL